MYEIDVPGGHELGDIQLVARIFKCLHQHFPGHKWEVELDDEKSGGVVRIMSPALNAALSFTNKTWGYTLHLPTIYADPQLKCVMRAGGELLERMSLNRGFHKEGEITRIEGVPEHCQPINRVN